jgi:hypothetical protein
MRYPIAFLAGLCLASSTEAASGAGGTHGTADILDAGEWEIGLYAPLRRGFSGGWEISLHPLTALASPNVAVKKQWVDGGDWSLTSRHSLHFPARLLRALAREGTGGILVADATIPTIAATDHRLLASTQLGESTMLSLSARVLLGLEFGDSQWPSLDMPIAYPRTAAYQDTAAFAAGIQLDGPIWKSLNYRWATTVWALPFSEGRWAAESKTALPWRPNDSFTAQLSLTGTLADYPYGTDWHLLPGFDFIWSW